MSYTDHDDDDPIWTEEKEHGLVGPALLFALAPLLLVSIVLAQIFGDIVYKIGPPLLVLGFYGAHIWLAYRNRIDAPKKWQKIADRYFPEVKSRKAQMRNVAILIFALIVIWFVSVRYLPGWLDWLRDALLDWTIPWPWDWF